MAVLTLDGKFRELNAAFSKLVGYQEHEFVKAVWPSVHDRAVYKQQTEELALLKTGEIESVKFQSSYMHSQGLMVPVDGELTLVRDEAGEPASHPAHGRRALSRLGASTASPATMGTQHVPRRQPTPPERSPEERARAAAERAARRGESAPAPGDVPRPRTVPPEPLPVTGEDPFRVARTRRRAARSRTPESRRAATPTRRLLVRGRAEANAERDGSWFEAEPEAAPELRPSATTRGPGRAPGDPGASCPSGSTRRKTRSGGSSSPSPPRRSRARARDRAARRPAGRPRASAAPRVRAAATCRHAGRSGRWAYATAAARPRAPRRRFGRRFLAVLALALMGGAL